MKLLMNLGLVGIIALTNLVFAKELPIHSSPLIPGTQIIAGDLAKNEFFIVAEEDIPRLKTALKEALKENKKSSANKILTEQTITSPQFPIKHVAKIITPKAKNETTLLVKKPSTKIKLVANKDSAIIKNKINKKHAPAKNAIYRILPKMGKRPITSNVKVVMKKTFTKKHQKPAIKKIAAHKHTVKNMLYSKEDHKKMKIKRNEKTLALKKLKQHTTQRAKM